MIKSIQSICSIALALVIANGVASKPEAVYYVQDGKRHAYEVELLQRALDLTQNKYGKTEVRAKERVDYGVRFDQALARGDFDIAFMASSDQKEKRLIHVKIPLHQGMLGFRILLIKPKNSIKFSKTTNLGILKRKFIGGVGIRWEDFHVYIHNNMLMRTSWSHDELYEMLTRGDIDYLGRGASEIVWEMEYHKEHFKSIIPSRDVAIFYTLPFYYYLRLESTDLAERIEIGLIKAEADGSFKDDIEHLNNLDIKRVFYLENPKVIITHPMRFDWWLDTPIKFPPPKYHYNDSGK